MTLHFCLNAKFYGRPILTGCYSKGLSEIFVGAHRYKISRKSFGMATACNLQLALLMSGHASKEE
jgi:hypothetical protein